ELLAVAPRPVSLVGNQVVHVDDAAAEQVFENTISRDGANVTVLFEEGQHVAAVHLAPHGGDEIVFAEVRAELAHHGAAPRDVVIGLCDSDGGHVTASTGFRGSTRRALAGWRGVPQDTTVGTRLTMGLGALSPVAGRGEAARRTYSMVEFMEAKEAAATVEALVRARELVDAAHAADPSRTPDGRPAELVYADRMEEWITRLVPDASPLLRLAARCQHLERWTVPREDFPVGRAGYNAWRRTLYRKQADRAKELL